MEIMIFKKYILEIEPEIDLTGFVFCVNGMSK